jgi:hypothetical protein
MIRLLKGIKVNFETECWEWQGAIRSKNSGYGCIDIGGKVNGILWNVHRYSYTIFKGEIPKGLLVLHKCDNKICCNPNHLFLGTQKDNIRDMDNKKRRGRYAEHGKSFSMYNKNKCRCELCKSFMKSYWLKRSIILKQRKAENAS